MRNTILLISFSLGGLLETWAGSHLLASAPLPVDQIQTVLLGHLAACGVLLPGFLLLLPPAYRRSKWIASGLVLGFSVSLPFVGPGLVLLVSQWILKLERQRKLAPDYYFGDRQFFSGSAQSPGDGPPRSLIGHLRSPDVEVRRKAILAAAQLHSQSAIPILRLAQKDSDEQVRIFARNTLSQIAATLEDCLKTMDRANLSPQQRLDRAVFVAERFRDYVELGLISESARNPHFTKVIRLLSESLSAEPDNKNILRHLIRFCIQGRFLEQARTHLSALKRLSPDPAMTLSWELELCFEDRDWPSLGEKLGHIRRSHSQDPELMRIYNFWHRRTPETA